MAATTRLARVVQERDALSALQKEMMKDAEDNEKELQHTLVTEQKKGQQCQRQISQLETRVADERQQRLRAHENCTNAEEALEDIMAQNSQRELQLTTEAEQVKKDFNAAIVAKNQQAADVAAMQQRVVHCAQQEELLRNDNATTKITLEATISKLEQVTEELGKRIQSEMALGSETVQLRRELNDCTKKIKEVGEARVEEREKVEDECTELERALVKR